MFRLRDKVPMFPFHTWLPDAHTEAPTVGSVSRRDPAEAGAGSSASLPMLPEAAKSWAPWIGGPRHRHHLRRPRLPQKDMKRLIALVGRTWASSCLRSTLTAFGINAAIFGMVAHGLITGMLFFIAGSMQHNHGTREAFGGLLGSAPKMGLILGFCVMASLAPGLAGFWGEFPWILRRSSLLPAQRALFRFYMVIAASAPCSRPATCSGCCRRWRSASRRSSSGTHIHDVSVRVGDLIPILLLIVALGIFLNIVFHVTDPLSRT
jgi:NADH-quinone oxidoreductase subunit M